MAELKLNSSKCSVNIGRVSIGDKNPLQARVEVEDTRADRTCLEFNIEFMPFAENLLSVWATSDELRRFQEAISSELRKRGYNEGKALEAFSSGSASNGSFSTS